MRRGFVLAVLWFFWVSSAIGVVLIAVGGQRVPTNAAMGFSIFSAMLVAAYATRQRWLWFFGGFFASILLLVIVEAFMRAVFR